MRAKWPNIWNILLWYVLPASKPWTITIHNRQHNIVPLLCWCPRMTLKTPIFSWQFYMSLFCVWHQGDLPKCQFDISTLCPIKLTTNCHDGIRQWREKPACVRPRQYGIRKSQTKECVFARFTKSAQHNNISPWLKLYVSRLVDASFLFHLFV